MVIIANNTIHDLRKSDTGKYSFGSLGLKDVPKEQLISELEKKYGEVSVYHGDAMIGRLSVDSVLDLLRASRDSLNNIHLSNNPKGIIQGGIIALVAYLEEFVKSYLTTLINETKSITYQLPDTLIQRTVEGESVSDQDPVKRTIMNSMDFMYRRISESSGIEALSQFYQEIVGDSLQHNLSVRNSDNWKQIKALCDLRNVFAHGRPVAIEHTISDQSMTVVPVQDKTYRQLRNTLAAIGKNQAILNEKGQPDLSHYFTREICLHFWTIVKTSLEDLSQHMHPSHRFRIAHVLAEIQKMPKTKKE